jgi:hypothetical protein
LQDFGDRKEPPSNPRLFWTEPGIFHALHKAPALFYHPEGKFAINDKGVVFLENYYGALYQVIQHDFNDGRVEFHRGQRRIDIERHNDDTKQERNRRRASDYQHSVEKDKFNVPFSPIESYFEKPPSIEQQEQEALRRRAIPDDIRNSPLTAKLSPLVIPDMSNTQTEQPAPSTTQEGFTSANDDRLDEGDLYESTSIPQEPIHVRGTFNIPYTYASTVFSHDATRERIRELRESRMGRGIPESIHGQAVAKGFLPGGTGHPSGGGPGAGGPGGGEGGNPPQGNPPAAAPQVDGRDDRLMGAPPEIFDGNPADADRFLDTFKQYCC